MFNWNWFAKGERPKNKNCIDSNIVFLNSKKIFFYTILINLNFLFSIFPTHTFLYYLHISEPILQIYLVRDLFLFNFILVYFICFELWRHLNSIQYRNMRQKFWYLYTKNRFLYHTYISTFYSNKQLISWCNQFLLLTKWSI